ncbi:MAG: ribosomal-processing cysteine protease Prp [Eubacterium sp.]|nr:ribosomal-processing cysteine protease Prp [Eubacterium sp.]
MIKRSDSGRPYGFRISGHAGYSESGTDIVCAGVSALSINTINSIENLTETRFTVDQSDKDNGILELTCKEPVDDKAILLLESLDLGIREIEKTYSEYVTYLQ